MLLFKLTVQLFIHLVNQLFGIFTFLDGNFFWIELLSLTNMLPKNLNNWNDFCFHPHKVIAVQRNESLDDNFDSRTDNPVDLFNAFLLTDLFIDLVQLLQGLRIELPINILR